MAGNESGQFWNDLVMQPSLSPAEKGLRDQFVKEYLLDFDAWAACVRVGFLSSVAPTYASMLMQCPYVQREIARIQHEEAQNPREALKKEQIQIKASLMREAHYKGPGSTHAARVTALAKLASMADMDAPIKTKSEVTHRGGVMLVPAIANVDDWEKQAQASQGKLVEDARH